MIPLCVNHKYCKSTSLHLALFFTEICHEMGGVTEGSTVLYFFLTVTAAGSGSDKAFTCGGVGTTSEMVDDGLLEQ